MAHLPKALPKPVAAVLFSAIVLAAIAALGILGLSARDYLDNASAGEHLTHNTSCDDAKTGKDHSVVIENGVFVPAQLVVTHCDTITISNRDETQKLLAFGQHDHHVVYDTLSESAIRHGDSFTFTATEEGTFLLHDHYNENTRLEFSVTH